MIIESLANFAAYVGNTYFIAGLSILLFAFSKGRDYSGLIYLLFFTMIYNVLLKHAFKFPLPETCPTKGYGFPSGHMNFHSVFFFWIFCVYKKPIIRIFSLLLLTIIGWGIIYRGFHYAKDVLLTPPFACFLIFIYRKFMEDMNNLKIFLIINASSLIIMFCLYIMNGFIHSHVLAAYCMITSFGLSLAFFEKIKQKSGFKATTSWAIIFLLTIMGSSLILERGDKNILYHVLSLAKWGIVGISAPLIKYLLYMLNKKEN